VQPPSSRSAWSATALTEVEHPLGKQLQAANFRSKDVQKRTDAELQKIVHDGQANMPPFGDQTERRRDRPSRQVCALAGKVAKK